MPSSRTRVLNEPPILRPLAQPSERLRVLNVVALSDLEMDARPVLDLGRALAGGRFSVEYGWLIGTSDEPVARQQTRSLSGEGYPAHSGWRTPWYQVRLARQLAKRHIQIVHTYDFSAALLGIPAAWLAGVPVIIASIRRHGTDLSGTQRHAQRLVCNLADCIVVNSASLKEWLVSDGYDAARILVIRDGIEVPAPAGRRYPDERIGVSPNTPIVALVSPLIPFKGLEDFIDAAAILSWQRPDVRFLIAGTERSDDPDRSSDRGYRATLEMRVERLHLNDTVQLIGHPQNVSRLLEAATISVVPALSDGLSTVLLESMASGVPVVATRTGGAPEAIEDGATGLLVPPGDPQELATAIGEVLNDPMRAAAIGEAAREAVRSRFGMERMVRATGQLYLDLLARKAAHPGIGRGVRLDIPASDQLLRKRL